MMGRGSKKKGSSWRRGAWDSVCVARAVGHILRPRQGVGRCCSAAHTAPPACVMHVERSNLELLRPSKHSNSRATQQGNLDCEGLLQVLQSASQASPPCNRMKMRNRSRLRFYDRFLVLLAASSESFQGLNPQSLPESSSLCPAEQETRFSAFKRR